MVVILDYGAGNLRSVARAVARLGVEATISSSPEDVRRARAVILPGVGAAADTMGSLEALGLVDPIRQVLAEDRPFLGICMGLQALLDASEEGGYQPCMGILPGRVRRLPAGLKVPHMGWNQVWQRGDGSLLRGIPDGSNFYFVHSFYADVSDPALVAGVTEYGGFIFPSLVRRGNLVATQFHPEKSGDFGLKIYENFLSFV